MFTEGRVVDVYKALLRLEGHVANMENSECLTKGFESRHLQEEEERGEDT